jgi:hypothetical protein
VVAKSKMKKSETFLSVWVLEFILFSSSTCRMRIFILHVKVENAETKVIFLVDLAILRLTETMVQQCFLGATSYGATCSFNVCGCCT